MILDLGCGGNLHKDAVGIDIVGKPHTAADIVCNLGFEPIPVDDDSVDVCISHHFIEHIPMAIWNSGVRSLPMVYLFNEIYRVLKDGGLFQVTVPIAVHGSEPHQQAFQDPTHVSFWVPETVRYFSGDYYGFHNVYGHTSRFEMTVVNLFNRWYMIFELRAIKNLPENYPYLLTYDIEARRGQGE